MPLRDHFHTTSTYLNWEAIHGGWPMMIAQRLNSILPPEYVAQPTIHLGTRMEIDIGALERESQQFLPEPHDDGGVKVASWAPAEAAILLETDLPEPSEYAVNVYTQDEFRLVAAIELVSPSNKDRLENRQNFVNKCETLVRKNICITIVDSVTNRKGTCMVNFWTNWMRGELPSREA